MEASDAVSTTAPSPLHHHHPTNSSSTTVSSWNTPIDHMQLTARLLDGIYAAPRSRLTVSTNCRVTRKQSCSLLAFWSSKNRKRTSSQSDGCIRIRHLLLYDRYCLRRGCCCLTITDAVGLDILLVFRSPAFVGFWCCNLIAKLAKLRVSIIDV